MTKIHALPVGLPAETVLQVSSVPHVHLLSTLLAVDLPSNVNVSSLCNLKNSILFSYRPAITDTLMCVQFYSHWH